MNTKKILCVIESLNSGGAERQLTNLAVLLKKNGHDVEVGIFLKSDFYLTKLLDHGIKCVLLTDKKKKFNKIISLMKYIIRSKPNTVITYLDPPSMSACLAKFIYPKFKLIVSERNTTVKIGIKEIIKFNLYRFADYVVPNSFTQKCFIDSNFHFLRKKNVVISNCIDTEVFIPQDINAEKKETFTIIVVARVMPQKNTLGFIEAVKMVLEKGCCINVKWFGYQKDLEYFEKCLNLLRKYSLEDYFTFYPPTNNIREELVQSDALCLPSFYEGYPNVICEAMSCELPIICSDISDNSTIVSDGINGFLFNPNNIDTISEAILKLYNLDYLKRKNIGKINRDKVIKNNSMDNFVKKYIDLI